jgi:orotate phosphoribosyltransferase
MTGAGAGRHLSPEETLVLLESSQALLSGHFRLSSGDHSDRYVQCARATENPARAERLGSGIAALFADSGVEAVASPALGGLLIGHEVARALGVRFLFAEREGGAFAFRRGFRVTPGERILLVEDVLTTGGSVLEIRRLAEAAGASAAGIAAIVDRTGGGFDPGIPVRALLGLAIARYAPDACPLCARGVPLVKPGSRPDAASTA